MTVLTVVDRAMVLAAGLGTRMRPITADLPKPLVAVAGRPLIDRLLDRLAAAGVDLVVVNTHYLAPAIESHLATRRQPRIQFSHEPALLETGGGVARALPHLGAGPFYVVNADVAWRDGAAPALGRLAAAWDDAAMDGLLLLQPATAAIGYDGTGDFDMAPTGRLVRRAGAAGAGFVFTGIQLLHPRLFAAAPAGAFSLNRLYDRALAAGRLFGLRHDGDWLHVGTPAGLAAANALLGAAR